MPSSGPVGVHLRWRQRLQQLPTWLLATLVLAVLAGCWALVYATGGTRTAFAHVFYVPIVLVALPFGVGGGVLVALVATVLCGPAMPLDVAGGESQELMNWLARGGFFVTIGGVSGSTTQALRRSFEANLASQLRDEVDRATSVDDDTLDPAWVIRIWQMLKQPSFRTVFQPIYALDSGRLIAVEALTRFDGDPPQTPDVWFDHAHRVGLGIDLELLTLTAALGAGSGLDDDVALSFNASPQLVTDHRLMQLLDQHEGRALVVEVTEHAVIDDYHRITEGLSRLRSRGLKVAIDDAGAGFASLRHIVRLQPDFIKLDPSLTQNLHNDAVRGPLAAALLQIADRTGSEIIVEGIETTSDLMVWRDLGARAAQGYLLARPGALPCQPLYGPLAALRRFAPEQHTGGGAAKHPPAARSRSTSRQRQDEAS